MYSLFNNKDCLLLQISTKFRDEMNPKLGFLRGREFIMKGCVQFNYIYLFTKIVFLFVAILSKILILIKGKLFYSSSFLFFSIQLV